MTAFYECINCPAPDDRTIRVSSSTTCCAHQWELAITRNYVTYTAVADPQELLAVKSLWPLHLKHVLSEFVA
ncbi:hypothetical protein DAPPUDRAFT_238196 [Daphnia pulex]|uniref:Uncharacterized protein n=1 Tax=Daphnia pulex TaxID=6669 RepID=E9G5R9_DAPPU|nr:hypothetical protein DAPPUDRAFT_238196 [Daphnia pulex]|eukprot:EFX85123.1 hypothetical protein DAPPUDRAFT_238196 [Daphnia pulex]